MCALRSAPCVWSWDRPHRLREVGEGRTARQSGQIRKEAALTRQGGSLSNLPPSPSSFALTADRTDLNASLRGASGQAFVLTGLRSERHEGRSLERSAPSAFLRAGDRDPRAAGDERHAVPRRSAGCGVVRTRRLALSGARPQIPAAALRGPDRPGSDGPDHRQFLRGQPHPPGLYFHRRARHGQDDDRAHPRPRASITAFRARSTRRASTCRSSASTARRSWICATST